MMTSGRFVFYLTCLVFGKIAQTTDLFSSDRFVSAHVGDSVTLRCFYNSAVVAKYYWYKQALGERPRLISSFYLANKNLIFHDEFKNNSRFTLDTETGKNHLKISDLRFSDSAAYFCASSFTVNFKFTNGAVVIVTGSGSNTSASVHQSSSEIIQPGGSVTLTCTVHTGSCGGEHSVYWFKTSQEESHPGLIYTHEGRNDQCERKDDTQTHTCVYNLPMESLDLSHAGTYYCAVASCGHILFGNGTKLDIEDDGDHPVLVYFLSGALAVTTIPTVFLTFLLYNVKKRGCQCGDSRVRASASPTTDAEGHTHEDHLHYAALRVKKASRSRRPRSDMADECVYTTVKQ